MFEAIENKSLLDGTDYFELLDGKYQNKCWNDGSLYINEYDFAVVEDVFSEANKEYDHFGFVEYDGYKSKKIIKQLKERMLEIENSNFRITGETFSADLYKNLNECLERDREKVQNFIAKIIGWMERIQNNDITLLGI